MTDSKLSERFEQAKNNYEQLKYSCEQQVTVWKWASAQAHELHPYYFLRNRWKRGKWIASRPKRNNSPYLYGFNSLGQIVIIRQFLGLSERCYEEFFVYRDNLVEGTYYTYHEEKTPINATLQTITDGKISTFERRAIHGYSQENYIYQQGMLTSIIVQGADRHTQSYSEKYIFAYGQNKKLESIVREFSDEFKESIYRRPLQHETIPLLSEKLKDLLVSHIPELVKNARIQEQVYCLVLAYDNENQDVLPPLIGLGKTSEKEKWLQRDRDDLKYYLWNPAEFEIYDWDKLRVDDREMLEVCNMLNQEIALHGSHNAIRNLLVSVAKSLSQLSWGENLNISNDFTIVAADFELSDLAKNMKETIPKDKWKAFKKQSFI